MLKRLEKEYEVDLAEHVSGRLLVIKGYMEKVNEAIGTATGTSEKLQKKNHRIFKYREVLEPEEGLLIDIDAIEPDPAAVEDHKKDLGEILGKF